MDETHANQYHHLHLFSRNCSKYRQHIFFFFNDTATTEIYTLSLHDALPISKPHINRPVATNLKALLFDKNAGNGSPRSEEHTSELQSLRHLVCRLLLETKNRTKLRSFPN